MAKCNAPRDGYEDGEPDCGEVATWVDNDPRLSGPKTRCDRHRTGVDRAVRLCPACEGTGEVLGTVCRVCDGNGRRPPSVAKEVP